jgi:hypothetical protein
MCSGDGEASSDAVETRPKAELVHSIDGNAHVRPMTGPELSSRVLEFLAQKIDTVPQFEALLLLWQTPDKGGRLPNWRRASMCRRIKPRRF